MNFSSFFHIKSSKILSIWIGIGQTISWIYLYRSSCFSHIFVQKFFNNHNFTDWSIGMLVPINNKSSIYIIRIALTCLLVNTWILFLFYKTKHFDFFIKAKILPPGDLMPSIYRLIKPTYLISIFGFKMSELYLIHFLLQVLIKESSFDLYLP